MPSPFPEAFLRRVAGQLPPAEFDAFAATLAAAGPPVSVRLNRRKPSDAFDGPGVEPVPWLPDAGRYLPGPRPVFALDPFWHAGAYYVQEASSMLVAWALRHLTDGAPTPRRVLDLCAAPGGKATLLADILPDDALLVANEVIRSRVRILSENLTRWGWPNVLVTNHDPDDFAPALAGFFDTVLIDAPCSGEGLFRREPETAREWSEENAAMCAARQRRILAAALPLVAPGGLLLYSTCTFNPAEDDGTVTWALAQCGWERLELPAPPEWGVIGAEHGILCWPHRVRGEGLYLAALRRTGAVEVRREGKAAPLRPLGRGEAEVARSLLAEPHAFTLHADREGAPVAVPAAIAADVARVTAALPRARAGLPLGTFKGRELAPSHELALSIALSPDLPALDLDREEALRFLRKETLPAPKSKNAPRGWARARYGGVTLGWGKVLPDRVNNYLPTEWRLRMADR